MATISRKRYDRKRGETKGILLVALLFFILFPYIFSGFSELKKQTIALEEQPGQIWVIEHHFWGTRQILMEEYLNGMVAATIPAEYHMETLKAQVILLRSFCMSYMEKKEGKKIIDDSYLKPYYLPEKSSDGMWQEKDKEYGEKIKQAVEETKGIVMVYEGDIINPPFCRISNGNTRDISEYTVHPENYRYIKTVECEEDKMAEDYIQYIEMTPKELEKIIKKHWKYEDNNISKITITRDNRDYVKEIKIGSTTIDGEKFRQAFGIVSSDFSMEKINDIIQIKTKGMGHGYGFSQYSANQMAIGGKNYRELLEYFFENISLEKI